MRLLLATVFFFFFACGVFCRPFPRDRPAMPLSRSADPARPGPANCTEHYLTQKLDHFSYTSTATYQERYFLCHATGVHWQPNGTIFFYTGNEGDIEQFLNMTGLMWENAARFNALLVFAEHRFFGKSLPYPGEPMPSPDKLTCLTTDQAMADYSVLINTLRARFDSPASPIIAFGGSYGGLLAAWMRIKYPDVVDGSIAASGPAASFEFMDPPYNPYQFAEFATMDATPAAGAAAGCVDNVKQSWNDILDLSSTSEGLAILNQVFMMCSPMKNQSDVSNVMNYASQAFYYLAMSSYPYPSSYMLFDGGILPAYPMRVSCEILGGNFSSRVARLEAFVKAILVFYNGTGDFVCLNPDLNSGSSVNAAFAAADYLWGYLACTEIFRPFGQTGTTDMFWSQPWNTTTAVESCQAQYGVTPQPDWAKIEFGGWGVSRWGSNIFFSNGGYDPVRAGGITHAKALNITAHVIPMVGHHADLFFGDAADTPGLREAREMEMRHVESWIAQKRAEWR